MADVLVQEIVDFTAVLKWRIAQPQQRADLVQRHVQLAALADERQPVGMRRCVHALVAVAALRGRDQAFALVEAGGFDRRAGRFSQVSNAQGERLLSLRT